MRILVIEDEQPVADYIGMFLSDSGYSIDRAGNAATALEKLGGSPFDLILLDLVLPDASGPDLLPRLRAAAPDTPVLVVTGLPREDERVAACLANGATEWVPKTSRAEQLLAAVRRALRH